MLCFFVRLFGCWLLITLWFWSKGCISEVGLVVGLLQCNRLTLLPTEVSEGGGRWCHLGVVGVILVSYPEYTHWVYTPVSYSEYTRECHSRVILNSRVILGCPVISLPLMSESYECTNAAHRSISWCDLYMASIVGSTEGFFWHRTLS